jgi:O-antigen/teichoic acid export membrane protein
MTLINNNMTDKEKSYHHILKCISVFGGVQGLNILIGLVRNKIVAVLLGPEGMGLISLFNSTLNLVSSSTNLGITSSAVREISGDFDRQDSDRIENTVKIVRSWSFLTALVGMLLCMAFSQILNDITFTWGDHTLHFVLLSPIIAMLAVTGGETAILKGLRKLRQLAKIQVYAALITLVTTVPIYYYYGESGIVPSLLLFSLISMSLTIYYSFRLCPLRISFSRSVLSQGSGMVKLGIAFVMAAIMGSGAEFAIRTFLNRTASLDVVGLYNAGFMMTMTYAGMIFSAMDTDYFPRLSAIGDNRTKQNNTVNNQISVSVLLISPLLVAFMLGMPFILPLLFSGKFMPVIGMMQITVIAMFLRAVKLPLAYINIAKGNSTAYMILEGVCAIVQVLSVILGYRLGGLTGTGAALLVTGLFDLIMLMVYTNIRYGYSMSKAVVAVVLSQLPVILFSYAVTFYHVCLWYWIISFMMTVVSSFVSYYLYRNTSRIPS